MSERIDMASVLEHCTGESAELYKAKRGHWEIQVSGWDGECYIPLFDLLHWLKDNRPDLLKECGLGPVWGVRDVCADGWLKRVSTQMRDDEDGEI